MNSTNYAFRILALFVASLTAVTAAALNRFGAQPLQDVQLAAQNNNACSQYLTTNQLAALVLTVTWPEDTGNDTTLTPSPMTLGRADGGSALYYNGQTTGTYRRAFWHAGVGAWQLDDSGLGTRMAVERFSTSTSSATVATEISRRYCQQRTLDYALAPWYACRRTSGICTTIYNSLWTTPDKLTLPTADQSTSRMGGVQSRTCRLAGQTATFPCHYVSPANAEGYKGSWTGSVNGTPPLTTPFYLYSATTNGVSYEWRHWLRADTGFDIEIAARRTYGANSRLGLQWSQTGLCDVTMNRGVCGVPAVLTVSKTGSGSGTVSSAPSGINCGTDCTEFYSQGTAVTLTATPASGSSVLWAGCTSSSGNSCSVTMTATKTVTATFSTTRYTLQVAKAGTGQGTVTSTPAGINCGTDCTEQYTQGTAVTLTAVPSSGSTVSWSGCTSQSGNSCSVTMSASKTVVATFSAASVLRERLVNGSFSSGSTAWTRSGDFWMGTNLSNYRTAPGYAAGGVDTSGMPKNSAVGSMWQGFIVPGNATSATLSVWINVTSEETAVSTAYDTLSVILQDSGGAHLATICSRSNLNKRSSPTDYSSCSFNLAPYAGRSLRVYFRATTDGSLKTTFRIDDVSVMTNGN